MTFATDIKKELLDTIISDCKNNPKLICIIACKNREQFKELLSYKSAEKHKKNSFLIEYYFNNGSLIIIRSSAATCRGYKAHKVYYDKNEDKEIINSILNPCGILTYNRI